jgi:cell division protein FtsB
MPSIDPRKISWQRFFDWQNARFLLRALRVATNRFNRNKHRTRYIKAQTTLVRTTNRLLFFVIAMAAALTACLSFMPQKYAYEKKLAELKDAKTREELAENQLDSLRIKLEAIKSDPVFLEIQARDRLQVYRPGETIYRIQR